MAPRNASYRIFSLLVPFLLRLLPSLCEATMYTCVIYGSGVPNHLKNKIDVDTDTLLQKLKDYEGAAYIAVAPGQSLRRRDVESTPPEVAAAPETTHETNEEADEEEAHRALGISCPSTCSNSGSTYCRALGCAYCGTCRRRELFSLRGLASTVSVVNAINKDLAVYCHGIAGCSLWANLFVVNPDGSLSPAR